MNKKTFCTKVSARQASELRRDIFNEMLRTRGHKYKWWLVGMHVMSFVATLCGEFIRAEILVSLYAALHKVDDVIDGDVALPKWYSTPIEYVKRKMRFTARPTIPSDDVECLLFYALTLSEEIGLHPEPEIRAILASMLFDAERRNPSQPKLLGRKVLHEHFHSLDIIGTIDLCLKLFREVSIGHNNLQEIGEAYRTFDTLAGMEEDFRAGYCNIPLEDVEGLAIDAFDASSPDVQRWCRVEAKRGLKLLQEYREKAKKLRLRTITRIVLPLFYERPARKYFNQVLRET